MKIQSNSPQIPQRLETRVQNQDQDPQPPQAPKDQVSRSNSDAKSETFGQKAFRIASRTAVSAGIGYVGGLVSQQPGFAGTAGTVYMGLHGLGEGASTGWHVGKRVSLAFASGTGNEYARGGLALLTGFGSPFVGAAAVTAAGIIAAAGGPVVGAAVFGSMTLAKELAR